MRIERRQPDRSQAQLGAMFGGVLVVGAALGALWLELGLPRPRCYFRELTGVACPTCGSTRLFEALLAGDLVTALRLNPLIFLVGVAVACWAALSTLRLFLPVPSWQVTLSDRERGLVRGVAVAALISGWAYVILRSI